MLPDDVLLEIFAFYVEKGNFCLIDYSIDGWHTLVHVCRTWIILVFGSPRRLNLRLRFGTATRPVRAQRTLDIWPPLPIVLCQVDHQSWGTRWDIDTIIEALEHNDRVCEIELWDLSSSQFKPILAAMQEPFPALTNLRLHSPGSPTAEVIPNSFLGGSAPSLRGLTLREIAFPGLRILLSSATHLVQLDLWRIPHSGYMSPEAMVTCLSTLTRVETLRFEFLSRGSRRPHPLTRSALPALTHFRFKGFSEYLEDFVARIDTPMLHDLEVTFFRQPIFDTPNLPQFISRTQSLKAHDAAGVVVSDSGVWLVPEGPYASVGLDVPYNQSGWPSTFAQICRSSLPHTFLSLLQNLYLRDGQLPWEDELENIPQENPQWLELLHPFTAVKSLYLEEEIAPLIAPTLQGLVGERVVEILPELQGLFFDEVNLAGSVQEAISQFVAA